MLAPACKETNRNKNITEGWWRKPQQFFFLFRQIHQIICGESRLQNVPLSLAISEPLHWCLKWLSSGSHKEVCTWGLREQVELGLIIPTSIDFVFYRNAPGYRPHSVLTQWLCWQFLLAFDFARNLFSSKKHSSCHCSRSRGFRELNNQGISAHLCSSVSADRGKDFLWSLETGHRNGPHCAVWPECGVAALILPMPWLEPPSFYPRRRICSWHPFLSLPAFSSSELVAYFLSVANSCLYSVFLVKVISRDGFWFSDAEGLRMSHGGLRRAVNWNKPFPP